MNMPNHGFKSGEEGKGTLGCVFAIVLMVVALVLAFKLGPPYVNHYGFKGEMKQVASRSGARAMAMSEENIKKDVIQVASKNNIDLKIEDIKITRPTGQIVINVKYNVPVNFFIMTHDLSFEIEESSWAVGS